MRPLAVALALVTVGCAGELRATDAWTELRSDHFRVLSDIDAGGVARELPRVETILAGIAARVRPDRPLPPRIDVLWLRSTAAVAALGVDNARGYYLPHQGDEPATPPLIVVAGEPGRPVEQALTHELAHVVFVDAAPGAPAWLAEGMAAWWDTLDLDGGNVGFVAADEQASLMSPHARSSSAVHLFAVSTLLHASYDLFHYSIMAGWAYASARSFVAMLEGDGELARRLDAYVARLRAGVTSDSAWRDAFAGVETSELQRRFDRFWATQRMSLPLAPWHGTVTSAREAAPAVERWFARARPWDSPRALAAAGHDLERAAADDSAERHYWSGVWCEAAQRWPDAVAELHAALARDASLAAAASALARVQARLRTMR